jgi:hypothetical protein
MMGDIKKNRFMKHADADGIRGYLEKLTELLMDNIKKDPNYAQRLVEMEGSPSILDRTKEQAATATIEGLTKSLKGKKGVKVKKPAKAKPTRSSGKKAKRIKAKNKSTGGKSKRVTRSRSKLNIAGVTSAAASRAAKGSKGSRRVGGKTSPRAGRGAESPIGLTALLNKSLPEEVIKNMGPYPRRLENRTGRFAKSAEVLNVTPMPNSVEIQYTYMKDPYEVFEPENGNPMASWGRDPKRIIGSTIREIAQTMMGTRFGLVRTKRV